MEKSTSRLKILAILVAFMFAALSTRLWFLQVLSSASAGHAIERQSTRIVKVDSVRGDIFDAEGRKIVDNRISLEVRVNKQDLGDDAEAELLRLSDVLGIPVSDIRLALDDKDYFDYQPKPVAIDVDKDVAFYLKEHRLDFPGVDVVEASVRDYPEGSLAAHILGYVGQINAQEIEDEAFTAYGPNDLVGRSGLEQVYEHYLHGKKGKEKLLINSNQEVIRSLGEQEPVPGNNLVLSLDIDAQRIAERALVQGIERTRTIYDDSQDPPGYLKANSGTVIVMDPSTGAIKALASWPTFDPVVVRGRPDPWQDRVSVRQPAGSDPQPGDPAHVRAGLDVQAVRRVVCGAERHRQHGRLLPLPAGVRVSGRHLEHDLPQLDHLEPGLDHDRTSAAGVVRHRLLRVRRRLLSSLHERPAGRRPDPAAEEPPAVRVRPGHGDRPPNRGGRPDPHPRLEERVRRGQPGALQPR